MKIKDRYKFYIALPTGTVEVWPSNSQLKWKWEYHKELKAWRHVLNTDLTFRNTEGHKTFDALAALEAQADQCYEVAIYIHVSYDGETFTQKWSGLLPFKKGEWNYSACYARIRPRVNDAFTCILDNWKTDLNLLQISNKQIIKTLEGERVCSVVESQSHPPNAPDGVAWTLIRQEIYEYDDGGIKVFYKYTYCRLKYDGEETEPEGFLDGGDGNYYAYISVGNPTQTQEPISIFTDDPGNELGGQIIVESNQVVGIKYITEFSVVEINIDNALRLEDILDFFFLNKCEVTWCSDFFGINATGGAPDNGAYQYAESYLQELLFIQGSDVVRADNEEFVNARLFMLTFEEFWENLNGLNLKMIDDTVNGCIRIEHISYNDETFMLDLTQEKYVNYLKGMTKYSYNDADFPKRETFHFKYLTGNEDFDDANIEYDSNCASGEDKKYTMPFTVTNIAYLYNNEKIQDDIEKMKDVIVMVSTTNNVINLLTGPITNESLLNGPLAWSNIIEALYLWKRPLKRGKMNGQMREFLSVLRLKRQPKIGIPMILSDYFDEFTPEDLVRSGLGWGEVSDAEYSSPESGLELEVNY